jgi:hypothetical protein
LKKIFIFLIILFLFCHSKIETYAFNLVSNYSFENGKEFWATNYSGVLFDILEDEAVEGTRSAKITNNKTSSFGVEQIVLDISSTLTYKISGWIKLKEPYPEKAFIRIAWYKSFDASGSQFSTEDTPVATQSSSWQKVELIKNPPEGINSAKIRLLVFNGSAIFDNILVEEFIPPSLTPTPAPTETPVLNCVGQACLSPTNFPTQNSSPTNTPIPTPISYQNIYLSEVYPNPQTGENEWVEIYNDNDFIVNLNNWYIDDIEDGGSSPKKFSLTIQPKVMPLLIYQQQCLIMMAMLFGFWILKKKKKIVLSIKILKREKVLVGLVLRAMSFVFKSQVKIKKITFVLIQHRLKRQLQPKV